MLFERVVTMKVLVLTSGNDRVRTFEVNAPIARVVRYLRAIRDGGDRIDCADLKGWTRFDEPAGPEDGWEGFVFDDRIGSGTCACLLQHGDVTGRDAWNVQGW